MRTPKVNLAFFDQRPLSADIKQYCAGDVALLQGLYTVYNGKLGTTWRKRAEIETHNRIRLSKSVDYEPHSRARPWKLEGDTRWDDFSDYLDDDQEDDDLESLTARDCEGWEDVMIGNDLLF